MKHSQSEDVSDRREIEARVREMDRDLDICFLDELAPVLERSRRSREEPHAC